MWYTFNRRYKCSQRRRIIGTISQAGDIAQCRLPGDKVCNFTMNISSGEPKPIISALGQHWKLLASAHHLIKPQYKLWYLSRWQILLDWQNRWKVCNGNSFSSMGRSPPRVVPNALTATDTGQLISTECCLPALSRHTTRRSLSPGLPRSLRRPGLCNHQTLPQAKRHKQSLLLFSL